MQSEQDKFARFLKTREQAAIAFLNSDAGPLNGLVASDLPVSFFEPGGAVVVGNAEVRERYRKNAEPLSRGSYSFQILHSECAANIGYVVGIQRSSAQLPGRTESTPLNLRVTEIYRRENGTWRLVHRHADRVLEGDSPPNKPLQPTRQTAPRGSAPTLDRMKMKKISRRERRAR